MIVFSIKNYPNKKVQQSFNHCQHSFKVESGLNLASEGVGIVINNQLQDPFLNSVYQNGE